MSKSSNPKAQVRLHAPTIINKLEEIRQHIEKLSGSNELALSYVEKILRSIEFLRENNYAGKPIKNLDERYRRWNMKND